MAHRFEHHGPRARIVSGSAPEDYDELWKAWLEQLDNGEPVEPDVPAAHERVQARDAGEM